MPIQYLRGAEGRFAPAVLCDHCGRRIGHISEGTVYFRADDGLIVGILHKGCAEHADLGLPDDVELYADELNFFVGGLRLDLLGPLAIPLPPGEEPEEPDRGPTGDGADDEVD